MSGNHGPRRIACLQPSATVTLDAIGELDRVVACTRYCVDVVPALAQRVPTILADSWTANAGQILAARPDLVIASVPYQEKAVTEILKAGIRFLGLAPKTLADIYDDIAAIAGIIGRAAPGDAVIGNMQQRIETVRQRAANSLMPTVLCEEWGKPVIASQPWVAELVQAAGGSFLAQPGLPISRDELTRLNPDIIIAAWCGAGDRVPLEKIVADRGWQNTPAAASGRVYCIRDEFLNTPAPTLLRGLDALAWAIQPDRFPRPQGIRGIRAVVPSIAGNRVP
ncbi:MAG TPA: ABC transporter substrate-binding protein [Candidatus Sulfotelmatobacter sp.]|nr:ABC transporter substrate-binding protein [Candidatus Sulfotelmatobacter sp.]